MKDGVSKGWIICNVQCNGSSSSTQNHTVVPVSREIVSDRFCKSAAGARLQTKRMFVVR